MNAAKKILLIGGLIVCFLITVLIAIAFFAISTLEKDKNKQKTSAARQARWKPQNVTDVEPETEGSENGKSHDPLQDVQQQQDEKEN